MKRLVCSIFAVALAVSFHACEGHSVDALPPHYQHKMHHGQGDAHPAEGEKHVETKDPHQKHEEKPAPAHPVEAPAK